MDGENEELLSGEDEDLTHREELPSETINPDDSIDHANSIIGHNNGSGSSYLHRGKTVCCNLRKRWFIKEMIMLLKLGIPIFLMSLFQQLQFFITLLFVGQFNGYLDYVAAALASTFCNVSGVSVIIGFAMAADTLCPQSYGFKNYKRVGVIFQRGVLIISLVSIPVAAMWLNADSILLLLQQIPCVVKLAGQYTRIFILALPSLVLYTMVQKYLQAQSLVWVFVAIGGFLDISTVVFSAILIVGADLGVIGAAISMVLSTALAPIILAIYIWYRKLHRQTWGGLSFESLTEWWQFLRLSIPGLFIVAFEWWSFEICTLVAGSIDKTQLAISTTILQVITLLFMIPLGMSVAVNVRVGNELGAGNPLSAKRASYVALVIQIIVSVVTSTIIIVLRNYIGRIFTSEEAVIAGVGDAILGAIVVFFIDQIQGLIGGIMRATGKQLLVAVINFFSFYLVGLPVAITLALVAGLKAKGLWMGLSVGSFIQGTLLLVSLFSINWKKESEKNAMGGSSLLEKANGTQSTEEDSRTDKNQESPLTKENAISSSNSHIELREIHPGENSVGAEEDAESNEVNVEILYEDSSDTEQFLPRDNSLCRTKPIYSTSSKFCQSKSSIIISRTIIGMVCLAILLGGAVLAGVFRHNPVDCDVKVQNCSDMCQSSFILPESSITEEGITPTSAIKPTSVIRPTSEIRPSSTSSTLYPFLAAMPTPVITNIGDNKTNCQCYNRI